jgi:hypothetical protein
MSQLSACVQISRIFARKSALIESLHYARTQIRCTTVRLPLGRRRVCSLVVTRLEEPSSEAIHAPNSTAARSARLACSALEVARRSLHCASSPLVGEDRGGGSRRPTRQASGGAFDNLLSPRDPHPRPPPQEGAGALTPSVLSQCSRLQCLIPELMIGRRTASRGESAKRLPPSLTGDLALPRA